MEHAVEKIKIVLMAVTQKQAQVALLLIRNWFFAYSLIYALCFPADEAHFLRSSKNGSCTLL